MASVPNTNIFPTTPKTGAPATGEGEGGEFFASLLPPPAQSIVVGPGVPASLVAQLPPAELRPAGEGGEGEGEGGDKDADGDDAIAALFAQAEFVPVVQPQTPQVPPAAAAAIVTTPVPTAPDTRQAENPEAPSEGKTIQIQLPTVTAGAATISAPASKPATGPVPLVDPRLSNPLPGGQTPAPSDQKTAAGEAPSPDAPVLEEIVQLAAKFVGAAKSKGEVPAKTGRATVSDAGRVIAPDALPAARVTAPVAEAPAPAETVSTPASTVAQPVQAPPTVATLIAAPMDTLSTLSAAPVERAAASQPQPADHAIERDLDMAHEGEWLDRLARDIANAGASDGPMRFRLHPQTLGHMRVELTQTDLGTNIRLTVETETARAIIADAQPRLAAEARAQGVRIGQTDIDLAGNGHQAAGGDARRQEEARETTFIRTARGGAEAEAVASVETARPHRSDRYA